MFKHFLTTIFIIFFTQVKSQNIIGKKMEAQIGSSCKMFAEGGCTLNSYRLLRFEKDSVFISHKTIPDCTPVERNKLYENMTNENLFKSYKWKIIGNEIVIKNFDIYKEMILNENKIIALNEKKEKHLFIEIEKSK